ncbi:hypothetical protein [Ciceribacter sp. RN22]|uniref:hypothetical protein n=1 Tax=Ciceribacter sp. RN22 TaxID=2954932 RepID=UPI0020931A48|nr:hypothetical protein [Ciceribacter sp. RN22]MCO6178440.1 hypothetical protein [Ciceribacter sp. RN22]
MRDDPQSIKGFGTAVSRSLFAAGFYLDSQQYQADGYTSWQSLTITSIQYGVSAGVDFGIALGTAALTAVSGPFAPAVPYGGIAVGAAANYGIGAAFHKVFDGKVKDLPTYSWHVNAFPQRYDPNPYTKPDPEIGGYRTSGYTGINTGFDSPSQHISPAQRSQAYGGASRSAAVSGASRSTAGKVSPSYTANNSWAKDSPSGPRAARRARPRRRRRPATPWAAGRGG